MRKKHSVFILFALVLTLALTLASCDDFPIPPGNEHTHSYSSEVTAPTCNEGGYTTYTCECGESYVDDETDAMGHNYVDGICSSCGTAEEDNNGDDNTGGDNTDDDNTGDGSGDDENDSGSSSHTHSYTSEVTAPKCEAGGYTTYTCECGESYVDDETDATGHNYVDGICENCGNVQISSEGLEYTLSDDGTYYIVSGIGTCTDTDIIIPDTYNNLPVKEIGSHPFRNCDALTSIEIPASVTSIGDWAFEYCRSLTSIEIPASVTSIDSYAFNGCHKLVEVINKSSLNITKGSYANGYVARYALEVHSGESKIVNIDDYLFYTYDGVNYLLGYVGEDSELILPEDYNGENYEIYEYAFYERDDIISVEIPASVTDIGGSAFFCCSSLTFNEYDNAYYLGNEENPYHALIKNTSINSNSCIINENTKVIAGGAFGYCRNLTSIEIPASVTSIGSGAFNACYALKSVSLGDNSQLQTIGGSAFFHCSALVSIEIPASVTSIGSYAFNACYKLVEVINKSSLDITKGSSANGYVAYYALEVHSGESKIVNIDDYLFYTYDGVNYLLGYVGEDTELILPENYNGENYEIYKYAFYECDDITSVEIPASVTGIDFSAFSGCSSLTFNEYDNAYYLGNEDNPYYALIKAKNTSINSCIINENTKVIGDAFGYCRNLTSIEIPASVTSIGSGAFSYCYALKSVSLGDNSQLQTIGGSAFYYCYALTSIEIPASVTSIGDWAFFGCSALENVYIYDIASWCNISFGGSSSNPLWYADNLYLNGELVTNLVIPDGVTSIGNYAFANYDALASVSFGDNSQLQTIGDCAFYKCSALKSVSLGDNSQLQTIGDCAFYKCSALTSIEIPASVTSIGEDAFGICLALKDVYIYIASWCNISFGDDTSNPLYYADNLYLNGELVTDVVIPDGVTSIPAYAFSCNSLTSIEIPASVTSIGSSAFSGCHKLVEVINKSSLNITKRSYDYGYVAYYALEVHSGESKIVNKDDYLFYTYEGVNYLVNYVGSDTELILPEDYNGENYEINKYAFYERDDITSVEIPASVTSIGDYAFYNCYKLVEVINKSSLNIKKGASNYGYVAYYAFEVHSGESKIVNMDDYLFYTYEGVNYLVNYVGSDTELILPEDYNGENYEINRNAFCNRDDIISVEIPASVTSIGGGAFYNCDALTSVEIPASVTNIGSYAFYRCNALESVTFSDTTDWYVTEDSSYTGGTLIDVTDPSVNAEYLISTYYWYKE